MDHDNKPTGHSSRRARRAMNRLIVACKEDILAESDAACAVQSAADRDGLRRKAHRRLAFVDELNRAVVSLGGRPATQASAVAWARSILRHLRAVVAGWHEGDGYAALARAEERTAKAYIDVLSHWLPDDARLSLKQQLAQIQADLEAARRMRGQH